MNTDIREGLSVLKKALVLSLTLMVFVFTGCSASTDGKGISGGTASLAGDNTESGTPGQPLNAGKDSVVIATAQEPTVFFCQDSSLSSNQAKDSPVLFQVYENLLWMDENGECQPWVATDYEMSEDGLEYIFTIRDDVYFQNGNLLTAEDVAFTFNLCKEKNPTLTTNLLINFDKAEVIDDTHVKFILTAPFAAFPAETSTRAGFLIDKSYYEEVGTAGYNEKPIGTGPYYFDSRVSGQEIVLKAYDKYWGGTAGIKSISIRPITNISTQFISLKSGNIDVVNMADIASCKQITDEDIATWLSAPSASRMVMILNDWPGLNVPTKDLNLRKAIQYAIYKEDILLGCVDGEGKILDIDVPSIYSGSPDPGTYPVIERDLDKAKEYLAKSSYNGESLKTICLSGTEQEKAAQIIQGQLMEAGITMEVVATDTGTYFAAQTAGAYDMNISVTSSSLNDVSSCNTQYRIQDTTGPIFEEADTLDALCAQANNEIDPEARKELISQVFTIVQDQAYSVPLYNGTSTMAYNKNLEGITLNPNNAWRVFYWRWK
ncbi:ABC transporter substrate-binding protein [Lachnospiraceae bacterium 54-53]